MKLLIITQKVDKDDPILGFFHGWIEEFAKHAEKVTVICLYEGGHHLPKNVKILSLGKEERKGRLTYITRFYKYIWQERKNYESVFVHMNQEYVLLGWKLWKLLGKKIFLWRNHAKGNWDTRIAVLFSNKVFCTSPRSFTARFKKTTLMPVGIDTDFFKPDNSIQKKPNSILFLGRISPVKNVDIFIESLNELSKQGVEFVATVAGDSLPNDALYEKMIQEKVVEYKLEDKVRFVGAVNQSEALDLYRKHEVYVNLTPTGSMDKTIFEAMACELTPVVSNSDLSAVLGDKLLVENLNIKETADKVKSALESGVETNFRKFIVENHSLSKLGLILKNYA